MQFGLGRLYPQRGIRSLRCWDTPGPPVLPDHQFSTDLQPICTRLGTIETQNSFGITFFISSGTIAAIHAHTVQAPSAYSCFQRLNPVKKKWVAWIFVPIRGGIEKFGFRTPLLPPGATLPQFAGSLLVSTQWCDKSATGSNLCTATHEYFGRGCTGTLSALR